MAAPADSSTTATTTASHDEAVVKTTTKPLPRAIQLAMAISSRLEPSSTSTSTKTLGEHDWAERFLAWMKLVFLSPMCMFPAALWTYDVLRHDDDGDEVISGAGGFVLLAVLVLLPQVYLAVVLAASGHVDLFAPQTPYAAWDPLYRVGFKGVGLAVIFTSFGATMLHALMPDQAWLLLVTCAYLLGLLVAYTIGYWLCLLRTYGGGGERREKNSCSGSQAIIDGLAYLYSRLLYEYAVRFLADADADADADSDESILEQLDTDSSSLVL